jgi:hypothetical protein
MKFDRYTTKVVERLIDLFHPFACVHN